MLRFVAEYLKNGAQRPEESAIAAGYPPGGAKRAFQILKHPEAAAMVAKWKRDFARELNRHVELATKQTIRTVSDVSYFDPRNFVHEHDGSAKNLNELDEQSAMAVAGFKTTETWVGRGKNRRKEVQTEYRLVNRVSALDIAAKILGDYKKDNEQRRSAREMTDDEIRARMLTLLNGGNTPSDPPKTIQ